MKVSDKIKSVYRKFPNQIESTISIGEGEKEVDEVGEYFQPPQKPLNSKGMS